MDNELPDTAIAIIGISGRFPSANTVDEFWENLKQQKTAFRTTGRSEPTPTGYVDACAPVDDIEQFDAEFFEMTSSEAAITDPQQRLFLECSYQAIEAAGYSTTASHQHVGVFGSTSISTYLLNNIMQNNSFRNTDDGYQALLGNDKDFLTTRVSYKLGLLGPSMTVQTACSSSLVATHLACQSLAMGECDMALAGGVSLSVPQDKGHVHKVGGILSNEASCRAFDKDSAGTVKGNGCGVILLKRYEDAIEDNDNIIAVIRATALNNDGKDKAAFMAPSVSGQASVIAQAIHQSGLQSDDIDYVETHGTGTKLGDMVEVQGLHHARNQSSHKVVSLGTLKPNIGHLDAAAGITAIIKAALVLQHQCLPGAASFDQANPELELDQRGMTVSKETQNNTPIKHAGISAFGVGGTNAHAILSQYESPARSLPKRPELVLLSATSLEFLQTLVQQTTTAIAAADLELTDIAHTLCNTRTHHQHRLAIVANDKQDLINQLQSFDANRVLSQDEETQAILKGLASNDLMTDIADNVGTSEGCESLPALLQNFELSAYENTDDELTLEYTDGSFDQVNNYTELLSALGILWEQGLALNLNSLFNAYPAMAVPLPGHIFNKKVHWVEPDQLQSTSQAPASPLTTVKIDTTNKILEIWGKYLGEDLDADSNFYDLGGDSIDSVNLLHDVELAFGIQFTLTEMFDLETPAIMAEELEHRIAKSATRSTAGNRLARLIPIHANDNAQKAVFVHPAGGTISCYVDMFKQSAPENYDVLAIPFPDNLIGQETSMRELAEMYLDTTLDIIGDSPLVLGGYSFGGNLTFEMAHLLRERGQKVPNLVFFDSHPPHAYAGDVVPEETLIETFALVIHSVLARLSGDALEHMPATYKGHSLDKVIELLIADGHVPPGLSAPDMKRFYHTWVINHTMLRTTEQREPLDTDVVIFNVKEPESPLILSNLGIEPVDHAQWENYISGNIHDYLVPGDHYTAFSLPDNIAVVSELLRRELACTDIWAAKPSTFTEFLSAS